MLKRSDQTARPPLPTRSGAATYRFHPSSEHRTGCSSVEEGFAGTDVVRKRGRHGNRCRLWPAPLIMMMALAVSLAIMALRPACSNGRQCVNLPAEVIDNQCNGEPVSLSGDLLTVVTTRPTARCGAEEVSAGEKQMLDKVRAALGVT
jgi:hypothetical protein